MLLAIGNARDMVITSHQSLMSPVTWPGHGHTGAIQNIDLLFLMRHPPYRKSTGYTVVLATLGNMVQC